EHDYPALPRAARAMAGRPWVGYAVVAAAFLIGLFMDQVDRTQRINILAPPVLLLLVWNVFVYLLIVIGYIVRYGEPGDSAFRERVARLFAGHTRQRLGHGPMRNAIMVFVTDWTDRVAPLMGARAVRVLHLAAAALALGVIVGLYLRGLAFQYLAGWQSTFLDASTVQRIAAIAYAPGAWLSQWPIPDVAAIQAIEAPQGENAAHWIHAMAATVLLIVILPRLALATGWGMVASHRARHILGNLDEPYFTRLLRGYRGTVARIDVMPFSIALDDTVIRGTEAIAARHYGEGATMVIAAPTEYGEVPTAGSSQARSGATIAVFSAAATPEREVHGAFLAALRTRANGDVIALVDEGEWRARWKHDGARVTEREAAWRHLCDEHRVPVAFVDFASPDLDAADAALERPHAEV
ncbi:MAG: DUF2868 domain-containing protein, partial [Casimicrobiaceae bacterium]